MATDPANGHVENIYRAREIIFTACPFAGYVNGRQSFNDREDLDQVCTVPSFFKCPRSQFIKSLYMADVSDSKIVE